MMLDPNDCKYTYKEYWDQYNEIASIMQLNETKSIKIICIISYTRHLMDIHMPNILQVLEDRGCTNGEFELLNGKLTVQLNESVTHKFIFMTPQSIEKGAMRGVDDFYLINLCMFAYEYVGAQNIILYN